MMILKVAFIDIGGLDVEEKKEFKIIITDNHYLLANEIFQKKKKVEWNFKLMERSF